MKQKSTLLKSRGFTAIELLIVILFLGLLAVFVLMALRTSRRPVRSSRINCVSNLKQIGLAFRMWSNDQNDNMPMRVSTNTGGTMEFIATGDVIRHFQAISNELASPKVLACSSDANATRIADFQLLTPTNISYLVGLDSDESQMQMILSGDRNVTNGLPLKNHILQARSPNSFGWTETIHANQGNIGLADGSASQITTMALRLQLAHPGNATNRLAIP